MSEIYTLYTRSNFDGLVCAALLKQIGMIDEIKFVHPKDVQDGKVQLVENSITASLPYCDGVYIAFDHHSSEAIRVPEIKENYIMETAAPSSARIIYEYFGGKDRFSETMADILDAVDMADCTTFAEDDILNPKGWVLLNYLMDPRTGFGRFRHFRISNLELMYKLVDLCATKSIEEIMEDEDVKERIDLYFNEQENFKQQVERCSRVEGKVAILDLRNEETIHVGNRFMIYAVHPECNVSVHIMWGLKKQNTVFAIGKSIINKSCPVDIGALMYEYDGGGHFNAGTCQVENDKSEEALEDIIMKIRELEAESAPEEN